MQSAALTHHNEPHLTACQVRGGNTHTRTSTHHSREETRPADFSARHNPRSLSLSSTSHASFFGINYASVLQRTDDSVTGAASFKIPPLTHTAALLNRICCDWTWIRRNRRLHGWLRSGFWNRRRRPSRILKHFCRHPWKMEWCCVDCWSGSARGPRRK